MENNKTPLDYIKEVNSMTDIEEMLENLKWASSIIAQAGVKFESNDDKNQIINQLQSLAEAIYYIGTVNNILQTSN